MMANDENLIAAEKRAIADHLFEIQDFEKAVEFYSEAIELTPRDFQLYGNRSLALYRLRRFEESLSDAETSLKLYDRYLKGYVRKFLCLYQLGRVQEGDETFGLACTLFPEYQDKIGEARCKCLMEPHESHHDFDFEIGKQEGSIIGCLSRICGLCGICSNPEKHDSDREEQPDETTESIVIVPDNDAGKLSSLRKRDPTFLDTN